MRRVLSAITDHSQRRRLRLVALLVPGVAGLLAAAVMSATAATTPPPSILSANGVLTSGQYLQSPDGHFRVTIIAEAFRGIPAVARHRLVYAAVDDLLKTDIHALAIEASAPA